MPRPLLALAILAMPIGSHLLAAEPTKPNAEFRPRVVRAGLPVTRVKPGDSLPLSIEFRNEGRAATTDCHVFVHFESNKQCDAKGIVWSFDHDPSVATTAWQPGATVFDGPLAVPVPSNVVPGEYWIHVGVYTGANGSVRFSEEYVGRITVDPNAPAPLAQRPPLAADELAARRARLSLPPDQLVALESPRLRVAVDAATGRYEITDRQSGVVWNSHPFQPRFGEAILVKGQGRRRVVLAKPSVKKLDRALELAFPVLPGGEAIVVRLALLDETTLEWSFTPGPDKVESIRLLDEALWLTDADAGQALMPVREGMSVPADSGRVFRHHFGTYDYEGCHMAMFGLVKQGSALLVHWDDPYITPELCSTLVDASSVPGRQVLSANISLRAGARRFTTQFLGRGDAVTIAQAYRRVAESRGLAETWQRKIARRPEAAQLLGASNVKLWSTLSRSIGDDGRERSATVNWTFDEAAQVAEHLHNDLKLDRVLFILGGWIHRGYDNQHPDILPAAPECGGNAALSDAARRIKAVGYTLGLHDNYQDLYRDSPSWNENLIMKDAKGNVIKGGKWAGGQAWLICAKQSVELAKRPQNLPAVKALVGDAAYFTDTTYAVGLQECHDPAHPLTKRDDLKVKCELSDYGREVFGLFGSECGREWAIPHADFFEGMTGVSGRFYHDESMPGRLGATVLPLFEMVYRDCIALHGKYGYDWHQAASYVLHHISIGRPLNYHSLGQHCYWKQPEAPLLPLEPHIAVEPSGPRSVAVRYTWSVRGPVPADYRIFVHFTGANGKILFQDDHVPRVPTSQWKPGELAIGPHKVELPAKLPNPCFVQMGMVTDNVSERQRLQGYDTGGRSYRVGRIWMEGTQVRFEPFTPDKSDAARDCFVRGDGGWTDGLHPTDRFIKNTHEVLSPLHELTGQQLVTHHEFLSPDRRVQQTVFGGDTFVTTNDRPEPRTLQGRDGRAVVLPAYGFLIESPQLVAFHASRYGAVEYASPALYVVRSLDGQPIATSKKVRVFHGFGDARLDLNGRVVEVPRETVLGPAN